jgi:uncharacterized membrane protein YdjX (TVP38/TMEM64 family)
MKTQAIHIYGKCFAALVLVMVVLFGIVQALNLPLLTDPTPTMFAQGGWVLVGLALLLGDVVLPIPSSLVMVAHGALFGFWLGAALSLMGGVGAACVGFWLGRRGQAMVARFVSAEEQTQISAWLLRWGWLAVLVTRPLPIIAEATAILAGTTALGWRTFLWSAALGLLPAAALYAFTGAYAAGLDNAFLAFGIVMAVAALVWCLRFLTTTNLFNSKD